MKTDENCSENADAVASIHSSNGGEAHHGTGRHYGEGEYDNGSEDETQVIRINDSYGTNVSNSVVNQTTGHREVFYEYEALTAQNDDSVEKSRATQQRLNASEVSKDK